MSEIPNQTILAMNAGSSSIKFALFDRQAANGSAGRFRGLLEDRGPEPRLIVTAADGHTLEARHWPAGTSPAEMLASTLDWLESNIGDAELLGVGHRVVHGGTAFAAPVLLDDNTIDAIESLTPLAPLHQPRAVEIIRAIRALRPGLPQVGCFDTAFHRDLSPPVSRYAIPRRFEHVGVRKYGFHGLSYEHVARVLARDSTLYEKRTVAAHLGNGASLCAMQHGRSRDTTMGFTALDGLVMGTRSGNLDPGVVLYMQRAEGLSVDEVEQLLYRQSGLLGVSGLSSDMRALAASRDARAREAIELFTFRIARETAALACTLGGLDMLVFTGGIGEHAPAVRQEVCARLAWLGVELDSEANERAAPVIQAPRSRVEVRIIPADEEVVIARDVQAVLAKRPNA